MSTSGIRNGAATALLLASLLGLGGCGDGSLWLTSREVQFLSEDVIDLMTIVYQTGEQGFVGDVVEPADLVDPAGPGNGFTATYDLPDDNRVGLGFGFGRASLRVVEDGLVNDTPLAFSIGGTDALVVEIRYELRYEGETSTGRLTDTDFVATLTATRASTVEPFTVEYFIDGSCFLGATFCEMTTRFRSPGRPRDGIEIGFGDGEGRVDDPDLFDVLGLDLDYDRGSNFRARGDVGCCAEYDERIFYTEIF